MGFTAWCILSMVTITICDYKKQIASVESCQRVKFAFVSSLSSASDTILRVSNQNGVSLLYIMLEIHHSGREPSIF